MTRVPFDPMKSAAMREAKEGKARVAGFDAPPLSAEQERVLIEARAAKEAEELMALPSGTVEKPLSVGAVNALVNQVLTGVLPSTFYIAGEVSNFRTYDRGHAFFTLKEAGAELPCVVWKEALGRLKFRPKDGMAVVARGAVKVYEPQGKLQLYVETLLPQGMGGLELAFRQLCEKLKGEGLFELGRKRKIPQVPQRVVVITSRTGDVLHDVLTTAHRRFPRLHVMLFPVRVQGEQASGEIVRAIEAINVHVGAGKMAVDLILLVRGGGSLEDLWAFNEEVVARAICGSVIPVATGIGHEPDVTIADLVGDLRGPTPTGVTELTIPDVRALVGEVESMGALLTRDVRRMVAGGRSEVERASVRLIGAGGQMVQRRAGRLEVLRRMVERVEPRHAIAQGWRRVEEAERKLAGAVGMRVRVRGEGLVRLAHRLERGSPVVRIQRARERVEVLRARLDAAQMGRLAALGQKLEALSTQLRVVSPQAVLERGYSITRLKDGTIVRAASQVKTGDVLKTRLAEGEVQSVVGKLKQESLF
jgi:exodeoxyribonuclease VII large subunit